MERPTFAGTAFEAIAQSLRATLSPADSLAAGDDPNSDIICDVSLVDGLILDAGAEGLEARDIRDCLPTLRDKAVRFRSEWSVSDRSQLDQQLVSWWGMETRSLGEVMDAATFASDVAPLMFHADMAGGGNADDIGPFHGDTRVWHLHPLVFMGWMNDRVDAHERVLRNQTKGRNDEDPNLRVQDDHIIGWQNLGGANPTTLARNTGQDYPEATYGGNTYEISVDAVADQAALQAAAQTRTRFHLRLLDYLDHINDRPQGVTVTRGWETDPAGAALVIHGRGDAVLVTPATGTAMEDWYRLLTHTRQTLAALTTYYPDYRMDWRFTDQAANPGPVQATAAEVTRRIDAAADAADPGLTAAPAIPAADLAALRLQVRVGAAQRRITVRFLRLEVIDDGSWMPNARWSVAFRAQGEMVCFLERAPVSPGQTVTLPAARNSQQIIVAGGDTQLELSTDGTRHFWATGSEDALAPASHTLDLTALGPTARAFSFTPGNGAYRVHGEVLEL